MSVLLQDVRYALRSLARVPGFTLVAHITLALGIGGTTAIFFGVDGILLRPLPYPEPAALVSLSRTRQANDAFSPADFLDQRDNRRFAAVAAYREDIVDMTDAEPVRLSTFETTAGFFDVLGLPPLIGRVYTERGDRPEGPRLVVISEGMWRQHFGADANVIGRTIQLNRIPFSVVGVMPAAIAVAPESSPRLSEVRLDPRVAVFGIAASAVVGLLFGLVPAIQGSRSNVTDALKDGGRTGTARTGAQKVLVVAEVAFALVLLIGAGLMLTSFARLRAVDTGYRAENVVIVCVPLPQARYNNEAQAQFYSQLHERLRANPVTAQSAIVFPTPFGGANAAGGYTVEGAPPQSPPERTVAPINRLRPVTFQRWAFRC